MRHLFKPAILLAPLLLVAAPSSAAPTAPPTMVSREARLAQAAGLIDAGKPADALVLLDGLLADADLPADRGQIEGLRSFALARLGKLADARKAAEFAVDSTMNPTLLLLRQLFVLRAISGDAPAAGQTLQLIAVSNPKWLAELPSEMVGQVVAGIEDANQKFDLAYTLVGAGYAPADQTVASGDALKLQVIAGLAQRGRLAEAQPFIDQLLNPVSLVRLAIDRRYQSLWPALEQRLGPGADTADAAYLQASKAAFDAAPDSIIARLGHAQALNIASQEQDALALADIAQTAEAMAKLPDNGLWLVNLAAQLLADLGQVDAGLARYAAAASLDGNDRPSLTGLLINHALLAEQVGRNDAALAAADLAERKAGDDINDYGKLFLSAVRACARHRQGDAAGTTAALAPLLAAPDRNPDAYFQAMLCTGRNDEAARSIISRLDDPAKRSEILFELQPFLIADHAALPGRRSRADLRALKARPDVKAAFAKWGRDLPAAVSPPR